MNEKEEKKKNNKKNERKINICIYIKKKGRKRKEMKRG